MDFKFTGLPALFKRFPDDATAREYYEQERWGGTPICPFCGSDKWYKLNDGKTYKCGNKECYKKYTVTVGTFFEGSHIKLNIWFAAIYLISAHKKGISSHQLAKDLNVTQKTAWFMLHRIRGMVQDKAPVKLKGVIEADETYMSRKYASDFQGLSAYELAYKLNSPQNNKGVVMGMAERGGKVIVRAFDNNNGENIQNAVKNYVEKHSWLMTDESNLYKSGLEKYKHETVNHSKEEWVKGDITTNRVENFWSVMRRGIYGIYHQVSYKHLHRYCDEFSFRYNNRDIKDNSRFSLSLRHTQGRLTYKKLIQDAPPKEPTYQEPKTEWD